MTSDKPWFFYDPENRDMEWFATEQEAIEACKQQMHEDMIDNAQEWPDSTDNFFVGKCTAVAVQVNRRETTPDDSLHGKCDYICDYDVQPLDTGTDYKSDMHALCDRINQYASNKGTYQTPNCTYEGMVSALDGVMFALAEERNKAQRTLAAIAEEAGIDITKCKGDRYYD